MYEKRLYNRRNKVGKFLPSSVIARLQTNLIFDRKEGIDAFFIFVGGKFYEIA